jgi:transposase
LESKTLAGTLKVEIVKPELASWDDVGPRLRAMRMTLGPALNRAMRELYPEAVAMLDAFKRRADDRNSAKYAFTGKIGPVLQRMWNDEMATALAREQSEREKPKRQSRPMPEDAFVHVTEYWTAETMDNIASRFTGEHLKDLLANRASFPSWHASAAFYARSRSCEVEGPPSRAVLTVPLLGAGKKATRVIVAPCGKNGEAMWRKLVSGEVKLGRVGISYDENRRKWFALISWSGEPVAEVTSTGVAAAHIGVSRFVQIVTADGFEHNVSGEDIVVARQRFAHRRASIQRCINTMGSGSKGHGVKRRMRPVTNLEDAESRFVTTRIRQIAAGAIAWCLAHNVGLLLWPDMTDSREGFERKTGGEAHEEVRRMIHSFPFYELAQAVDREGKQRGVRVEIKNVAYDSQTCPACGYADPGNLFDATQRVEVIEYHGRRFTRSEVVKRFKCQKCEHQAHRDIVACVNALAKAGHAGVTGKVAEKVKAKTKGRVTKALTAPQQEVVQ